MLTTANDLRVGALAYFVQTLMKRLGNDCELRVRANCAGLNWRTFQRVASGEVKLPTNATLARIAEILARNKKEEAEILSEARRMRDENRQTDKE